MNQVSAKYHFLKKHRNFRGYIDYNIQKSKKIIQNSNYRIEPRKKH